MTAIHAEFLAHGYFLTCQGVDNVAIAARFHYRSSDPWAVTLSFATGYHWVAWEISRELLANGLTFGDGEGDIRIAPDLPVPGRTWITLSSPAGVADLSVDTEELMELLEASERLVPWNTESQHMSMDAEIDAMRELF